MHRNLAELARAALTAASAGGSGAVHAVPTRLDSATTAAVADTCVRGDLGFALLLHRRKDGLTAEELYFSTRRSNGSWTAADHLSGGVMGIEPTSPGEVAAVLRGGSMALFGESETHLFTGRPQADEEGEPLRFHTLLVNQEVGHLDIADTSPGADPACGRTRKTLTSRIALLALFPGERITVHAVTRKGSGPWVPGGPYELTGPDPD